MYNFGRLFICNWCFIWLIQNNWYFCIVCVHSTVYIVNFILFVWFWYIEIMLCSFYITLYLNVCVCVYHRCCTTTCFWLEHAFCLHWEACLMSFPFVLDDFCNDCQFCGCSVFYWKSYWIWLLIVCCVQTLFWLEKYQYVPVLIVFFACSFVFDWNALEFAFIA